MNYSNVKVTKTPVKVTKTMNSFKDMRQHIHSQPATTIPLNRRLIRLSHEQAGITQRPGFNNKHSRPETHITLTVPSLRVLRLTLKPNLQPQNRQPLLFPACLLPPVPEALRHQDTAWSHGQGVKSGITEICSPLVLPLPLRLVPKTLRIVQQKAGLT